MNVVLPANPPEMSVKRLQAFVGALSKEKAWSIEVNEYKPKRSQEQNALLWALYTDIIRLGGEAMQGYTKEDLHEFFLGSHFGFEVKDVFGRKRQVPKNRSSRLNKQEFSDFVESIVRFMAEQGVYLELPGDLA